MINHRIVEIRQILDRAGARRSKFQQFLMIGLALLAFAAGVGAGLYGPPS